MKTNTTPSNYSQDAQRDVQFRWNGSIDRFTAIDSQAANFLDMVPKIESGN